ncbi:MFS allantoate transporter [Penicillium nucicola]|uniref:MFS allantoate transporter n=1 Tax=Penicillium nucicola TaxID=1850975 RepID=UPI0025453DA1|nr:MFS allantoate transporter [Penicillium nucicola]KAJ5776379.1 MFS allantoate transporter [Penicillium nucicola]
MATTTKDDASAVELEDITSQPQATLHYDTKIAPADGDDALAFLQTHHEEYSKEEERRVMRKVDIRMVLLMLIINGIQFIDKNTLSNAGTYGIATQANLKGQDFSLLVTIFYIGYLIAQYPVNLLMQRYPVGKFLTVNFVLWGATLAATGSAKNFHSLAAARFFLGVFESCLNPGFVLVTSSWWKREEQPARVGLWYSANGIIGAPSGVIFWAIAHIDVDGMFAYQWMFIIFGGFTVVFGISLWWLLPDSPLTASFLTERERYIVVHRLSSNKTGVKNTHMKKDQIVETLLDGRIWLLIFAMFAHNLTNSLQTTFMGIIIKGFGYSTYQAVLLNIPPSIIMAVTMIIVSITLSTKWGEGKRIFFIILCYIPGLVSTAMLFALPFNAGTKTAHLGAIFIVPMVASSAGIMYSLLASNVAGYSKKVLAGALFFSSNCVSNIVSPQVFLTREAPYYHTGITVCMAAFAVNIAVFGLLYVLYARENKARDADSAGIEEDLVNAFSDLTDRQNKTMRYKL